MTQNKQNSDVIYFTRLHWIIFFGPFLALIFSVVLGYYVPFLLQASYFFAAFSVFWIGLTWVTYYFSSITIKKQQVSLRTGIIVRQTVDIPLAKIETIDIRQSILGSILRYGTLVITGTGGTRHFINFLCAPLTCRRYIEQMMNQ
jgi:uncharacterized membrane protein YdbT with pleckstrin-like domain